MTTSDRQRHRQTERGVGEGAADVAGDSTAATPPRHPSTESLSRPPVSGSSTGCPHSTGTKTSAEGPPASPLCGAAASPGEGTRSGNAVYLRASSTREL